MNIRRSTLHVAVCVGLLSVAGCTVHPRGEREERSLAASEGAAYAKQPGDRIVPPLPAGPTAEDLVRYASLASPELEQRYWEWRSAIEQIPQDGTQPTNLVLFAGVPITKGSTSLDRTTVTVANDAMADIQWPSKPAAAARRALEEARAAGLRFRDAKLGLRQKVLRAYERYAHGAEVARLERENSESLKTAAAVAEAGLTSGRSPQTAVLMARNEAEVAASEAATAGAQLPVLLAELNAALGREPTAPLPPPATPTKPRAIELSADQLLAMIEANNPQLGALQAELRAGDRSIELAKLQYVPDFGLSASGDLGGVGQSLSGMVTAPFLRHEAIDAAIARAKANFNAAAAARRQMRNDLRSQVVGDVATLADLRRQLAVLETSLLPRVETLITLTRAGYESGQVTLSQMLEAQRAAIALKRLVADLGIEHEQRLLSIERTIGRPLDGTR